MRVPAPKAQEPSIDALGGDGQGLPVPNQPEIDMQEPNIPQAGNNDGGEAANNPFGKEKFDAGIDVDEEQDPKNYIEKLTGKLAQKLRSYNETDKDSDLNKFVINSLIPAAIPNLEDNDVDDVIKKVEDNKGGASEDGSEQQSQDAPDPSNDNGSTDQQQQPQMDEPEIAQESIDDLINEILSGKKLSRNVKNKNPFKPKKFQK